MGFPKSNKKQMNNDIIESLIFGTLKSIVWTRIGFTILHSNPTLYSMLMIDVIKIQKGR
jgi:hypothetical protein